MSAPRTIHALDQLGSVLRAFPPVLKTYFDDLVRAGFTDRQAIELVKALQRTVLVPKAVDTDETGSLD